MKIKNVLVKSAMVISALAILSSGGMIAPSMVYGDEVGVSFWLPGQYGSLAAVPAAPGWSLALIYYHASVDGGARPEVPQQGP